MSGNLFSQKSKHGKMQKIQTLLQKLNELANTGAVSSAIEQDLMLDYTRQLYDALLVLKQENTALPADEVKPDTVIPVIENKIEHEPISAAITNESIETIKAEKQQKTESTASIIIEEESEATRLSLNMPEEVIAQDYDLQQLTNFTVTSKEIRMFIGINDKYQFISELFGNNAEAYEEILSEINNCETKQDALFFLSNSGVTTLYGWEEDNFTVVLFQNVLNQFFATK